LRDAEFLEGEGAGQTGMLATEASDLPVAGRRKALTKDRSYVFIFSYSCFIMFLASLYEGIIELTWFFGLAALFLIVIFFRMGKSNQWQTEK
jgi:hypothetical protein